MKPNVLPSDNVGRLLCLGILFGLNIDLSFFFFLLLTCVCVRAQNMHNIKFTILVLFFLKFIFERDRA